METVVCNASSEKISDEILTTHPENSGVIFKSMDTPMSMVNINVAEKIELEGKIDQNQIEETAKKSDVNESTNVTDTLSQKTLSPTLIEHAFKVVKNIFSPDKNRSRPPSALTSVSQQRCSSRSPRNSVFLANKSDFCSLDVNLSNTAENGLKGDSSNVDQTGTLVDTPNQDSHNNTNESFLTTVSLIEESFQSAVTHLEDSGDVLPVDIDASDITSNSRNLDLLDPNNDTLCGSDCGLDNTMLKNGSFVSVKEKFKKSLSFEENVSEESIADDSANVEETMGTSQSTKKDKISEGQDEIEISAEHQILEKIDVKIEDEPLEINISELVVNKCEENLSTSENVENAKLAEIIKMADESFNKFMDKSLVTTCDDVSEIEKPPVLCSNIETIDNTLNQPKSMKSINKLTSDNSECESEKTADTNISTTTIVLSESNSDLYDALSALKLSEDNENAPPIFHENLDTEYSTSKTSKETSPFKTSKAVNNANITKNFDSDDKYMKKGNRSGGNTPNKHVKANRNKLNKSIDSVSRKNLYNSPKGRKSFRQKLAEDIVLDMPKRKSTAESSNFFFVETETGDCSKNSEILQEVNEGGDKVNYSIRVENSSSTTCFVQDSNSLSSQQSYTILNTTDNTLKRPVINSFEGFNMDSKCANDSPSRIIARDLEVRKTFSDLTNECTNGTTEVTNLIPAVKQSTPELVANSGNKMFSSSENQSTELVSPSLADEKTNCTDGQIFTPELEFSPVVPVEGDVFQFVHSVDKQLITSSPRRTPPLKGDCTTPSKNIKLNQDKTMDCVKSQNLNETFDKKSTPDFKNLNRTFDSKVESHVVNKASDTFEINNDKMNETFDMKASGQGFNQMNETFDKSNCGQESGKMNETFDLQAEASIPRKMNCTFDLKTTPQNSTQTSNKMNETFDLKSGTQASCQMNETFEKKPDPLNQTFNVKLQSPVVNKCNQTFEKIPEKSPMPDIEEKPIMETLNTEDLQAVPDEKFIQPKSCPTTIIEPNFRKPDFPEALTCSKECLNSSFISTTSSNTSLLSNGNVTVLMNHGSSENGQSAKDQVPVAKAEEPLIDGEIEEWSDTFSRPPSADDPVDNISEYADAKGNFFNKEDKVPFDPDLVQFIQEQFTSTDIEKICSVVEDFSAENPSSQTPKIDALNKNENETEAGDTIGKFVNPLSPHSFDFLSSIGGKPTGRDWSRESLYVKFDPLVQGPGTNSLIDFTKEVVEALDPLESSPANQTVVEHLLTISPQKKPDEIVPPLTPLSNRNRNISEQDKTERLKELKNEIYFLKNLYAERERINKSKMEEYESQITRLTGQSCILEDKLKESSERERSLVKRVQEQKQNLDQLKTIMEEYVKVITQLSTELENVKSENAKQLATLTAERDSYVTHLQNTEAAFTDVHTKYEKSKRTIVNLKTNEAMFRQTLADQMQKMDEYKAKTREAQEKACREIQKLQEELNGAKASHSQETARLRALLRKTELKLEAMQESLDQKIKENQQLTAICDELIEGRK